MLGHGDSRRRYDHSGRGGDIERVRAVAACADNFQHVHVVEQPDAVIAHPGGGGGDFITGFAFDTHGGEISRHLNFTGLALHNLVHHVLRHGVRQVRPP
ncbi:hypothetical protein SDC9_200286 [bioreactor metagenome]|uniref:Uncharacterized protein n=1 Tax=bioreactor metagenome TaxID=1076179 RepID=A0A645IW52_9ZZZZ